LNIVLSLLFFLDFYFFLEKFFNGALTFLKENIPADGMVFT